MTMPLADTVGLPEYGHLSCGAPAAHALATAAKVTLIHLDLAEKRRFILGRLINDLPQPVKIIRCRTLVHSD